MRTDVVLSLRDLRAMSSGPMSRQAAGVSLDLPAGGSLALLEPGGTGLPALLAAIAGLRPAAGSVWVGGRDVSALPAATRGLPLWRGTAAALTGRVADAVATLSPGERRCVALARAVAGSPRCLLVLEPLADLDEPSAVPVAHALGRLQDAGVALLIATRDPGTALRLADRIAVVLDGSVRQAGPAREVVEQPVDLASALATGEANVLAGVVAEIEDDIATVALPGGGRVLARAQDLSEGASCVVVVRPMRIAVSTARLDGDGVLSGRVASVRFGGAVTRLAIRVGTPETELIAWRPSTLPFTAEAGAGVSLAWDPYHAIAFRMLRRPATPV